MYVLCQNDLLRANAEVDTVSVCYDKMFLKTMMIFGRVIFMADDLHVGSAPCSHFEMLLIS